jgi:hypothetical protein
MLAAIRLASSLLSRFAAERPTWLIRKMDVSKLLAVVVAHHKSGV